MPVGEAISLPCVKGGATRSELKFFMIASGNHSSAQWQGDWAVGTEMIVQPNVGRYVSQCHQPKDSTVVSSLDPPVGDSKTFG